MKTSKSLWKNTQALNFFQRQPLNIKLTLVALAIFLAGIWSLALYAIQMQRTEMQHLIGEQLYSAASFIAADISQDLDDRIRGLEAIARAIDPVMLNDSKSVQGYLERRFVLNNYFNAGVFVLSADGTAIAEGPYAAKRIGVNFMDRDFIEGALKGGARTIGKPVMGTSPPAPMIGIAVPIRDAQGKVIGALAGEASLGTPSFLDAITKHRYGKTGGYLLVASKYRLILTATDTSRMLGALPAPGFDPMTDRFVQGGEDFGVAVNPLGVEVLTSARHIPVAGWYVAVELPAAEAFAPSHKMQRRLLLATAFLTLLAGGVTWWMLRRQLALMVATVNTLARLADDGQPLRPLPVVSEDEIGQLVRGFNRLLEIAEKREVALLESQERFRNLVDWMPDSVLVLANGKLKYVNPAATRMFGASSEEDMLDRPYFDFLDPDFHRVALVQINSILEHGVSTSTADMTCLTLDGRAMEVEVHGAAIVFEGAPAIQLAVHDLTLRKQAARARELLESRLHEVRTNEALRLVNEKLARANTELTRTQQELRGLYKSANEALEAERKRTARELHDELGQLLTALKMDLEALDVDLSRGKDVKAGIKAMYVILDMTIAATRRIAADLRPLMLDDLGLAAALDWLIHNYSTRTGIAVHLFVDESLAQVQEPIASALYRIVQESLTNVVKYAQASLVEVRLEREEGWVVLVVRDDGRGIGPSDREKPGTFGLLGIRERVVLLGGDVAITGTPGQGSELVARIPLSAAWPMKAAA